MIFQLTEEQLAVQAAAREFAQKELKPGVIERDRHMTYPKEASPYDGRIGLFGHDVVSGIRRRRDGHPFLCTGHGKKKFRKWIIPAQ